MFTLKCAAWSRVAADSGVSGGEDVPGQLGKKKKKKKVCRFKDEPFPLLCRVL